MSGPTVPPGGGKRSGRFALWYLLLVGLPAAIEFGAGVEVGRDLSRGPWQSNYGTIVPETSLAPVLSPDRLIVVAANGAALPVTMLPTAEPTAAGTPMPEGSYHLEFELHQLGEDGSTLARWEAQDELNDLEDLSLIYPWISARVSLSRIAGMDLPPCEYRLFVEVLEVEGAKAGKKAIVPYDVTLIPSPELPLPDPPNYMPGIVQMEFLRFERGPSEWIAVLRAKNASPWTLTFIGEKGGTPRPTAPMVAAEGERFNVVLASGSLWKTDPSKPARWSQMGTAQAGGIPVEFPPGIEVELAGVWDEHGFGIRVAQVFVSGEGQASWVASDPFEVQMDDSTTTGPVILWYAGMANSLPKIKGRRIEGWRTVESAE